MSTKIVLLFITKSVPKFLTTLDVHLKLDFPKLDPNVYIQKLCLSFRATTCNLRLLKPHILQALCM